MNKSKSISIDRERVKRQNGEDRLCYLKNEVLRKRIWSTVFLCESRASRRENKRHRNPCPMPRYLIDLLKTPH